MDETSEIHDLIIVGAGIGGLATAAAMHKIGVKSVILERSPTLRGTGAALSLWGNAWRVLDVLDVGDQLRGMYSRLTRARTLNMRGELLKGFELDECPGGPHELRVVERNILVETLASVLPEGTIRLDSRVVSVERESESGPVRLTLSDGSVIRSKVLIGADGVNSVVAKWMGLAPARYAGYMAVRGLAEYPEEQSYEFAITQYCGRGTRLGFVPLSKTKSYWFIVYNKANPDAKYADPKTVKEELLGHLRSFPEVFRDLLDHTPMETLSRGLVMDRWNLPGRASLVQNCVTLLGDAFHPMTPNLGQGGACALEDSLALARTLGPLLAQEGNPSCQVITEALEEYAAERNRRTLALTVKSFIVGYLMMTTFQPFVYLRDNYLLPNFLRPTTFLAHTLYDPGQLPVSQSDAK